MVCPLIQRVRHDSEPVLLHAMWETMASPKALQDNRVASSISRSKS